MAFKNDESFLEKLSIGAIGCKQVKVFLNEHGHRMIDLDRNTTSNKIWATKVKRLRVPDLLCLNCGQRVESRAKSKLQITMSDSPTVENRNWDYGLRDNDLVAFVQVTPNNETNELEASSVVNLFSIEDLRANVDKSDLGPPKSASEGAERDRTWPFRIPTKNAVVQEVHDRAIKILKIDGKQYTYKLRDDEYIHVREWEQVSPACIIASVLPRKQNGVCPTPGQRYDFISDLNSDQRETVYCAVKALGFLKELSRLSVTGLTRIIGENEDALIRLEAAGSLARLNSQAGWDYLEETLKSEDVDEEIKMETVLLLGELNNQKAKKLLSGITTNQENASELRSAAIWGIANRYTGMTSWLIQFIDDPNLDVSLHSIVSCSRYFQREDLDLLLANLGQEPRKSAAIIKIMQLQTNDIIEGVVNAVLHSPPGEKRNWLLYFLGLVGSKSCLRILEQHGLAGTEIANQLQLFWNYHHNNWTSQLDVAQRVKFLSLQE